MTESNPLDTAVLVTGNRGKLAEARRICGEALASVSLDLPELQSLDMAEVLQAKGEEAWRRLGRPLIVEETGLYVSAFGGFPGPLVKWMLEAMGAEGIARAALALDDNRVEAACALLYRDGERTLTVEGRTSGTLVHPARGEGGFGWDRVFLPDGESCTYGELAPARKDEIGHRGQAWRALMKELSC